MSIKTPVKATFTGSDVTGLAEYQAADFIGVADGGSGAVTFTAGILTADGTNAFTTVTAPSGTIVGTSDTQTLTNKTINSASNTITITESNISDLGSYITASSTDTLTNKSINLTNNTLSGTTAEFNTALNDGSFATLAGTETLTNKTISGSSNTLSNIDNSSLTNSSITVTDGTTSTATSLGGTITFSGTANEIEVGESSGTLTFGLPDDVTIGNNLTISGNLTVSGTTTTVNTETINLADNTITLNSNETGTPSQDGGIEIERGTSANKTLIWNETTDKWTVGSETFVAGTFEGALTGNVTGNVTGDVTGNADTATTLETARNIAGQSFDGSADITIASTDLSDTSSITLNSATQTLTNKTINSASNTITITESNISDLGSYITASSTDTLTNKSGNIPQWTNDSGYLTSFTETNDLTAAVTWANVPDANITQSSVTQHQAALAINESQITFTSNFLENLVEDTTPQLGGTLDANGNTIDMGVNVITDTKVGQWDTAYSWGDHASAGYLTSETSHADVLVDGDFTTAGIMATDGSGTYSIVTDNSTNWNTAYGWGDHSTAGYLTSFTETNDLTAAVTWANVPDANVTATSVRQHLSGGTGIDFTTGVFSVDSTVITGQTAETSVDEANDLILIYDNSNTALRKMTVANLLAGAGAGSMSSFTIS